MIEKEMHIESRKQAENTVTTGIAPEKPQRQIRPPSFPKAKPDRIERDMVKNPAYAAPNETKAEAKDIIYNEVATSFKS